MGPVLGSLGRKCPGGATGASVPFAAPGLLPWFVRAHLVRQHPKLPRRMPVINPAFSYIQLHRDGKIPTRDWKGDPRVLIADVREWIAQGFNVGVRTDRT